MEENLVEAVRREITRNRELLDIYNSIPTGRFGAMMIEMKIENAIKVLADGDVVEILQAYEDLKSSE
jgi:hypothetical protein